MSLEPIAVSTRVMHSGNRTRMILTLTQCGASGNRQHAMVTITTPADPAYIHMDVGSWNLQTKKPFSSNVLSCVCVCTTYVSMIVGLWVGEDYLVVVRLNGRRVQRTVPGKYPGVSGTSRASSRVSASSVPVPPGRTRPSGGGRGPASQSGPAPLHLLQGKVAAVNFDSSVGTLHR
eukprot:1193365-Prorocentrum_minimum.AAC.3